MSKIYTMTVNYDFTASVNLQCQTDTVTGQTSIVEASTLLDAQGGLFADWFFPDGRPTVKGQASSLEAFTFGVAMSLRELGALLSPQEADKILEQTISRLRLLVEAPIESKGVYRSEITHKRKPRKK